jgi:hypothetical protein
MKLLTITLFLLGACAHAGLPPTTSKVNGESTYPTTFKTDYGSFTGTRSGTSLTLTGIGAASGTSLVLGGTIDPDAILDLQSTIKVFNLTRQTTAQRSAITPEQGGFTYDTDVDVPYFYNGTSWVPLSGKIIAHVDTVEGTTASAVAYGSVNTTVLDFVPTKTVDGNCGTAARSSSNGFSYTLTKKCILNIGADVTLNAPVGNLGIAITRNSANLTTSYTNPVSYVVNTLNGYLYSLQANIIGEIGDVIRVQSTAVTYDALMEKFTMVAIGYEAASVDDFSVQWGGTTLSNNCTSGTCYSESDVGGGAVVTTPVNNEFQIVFTRTYSKIVCGVDYVLDVVDHANLQGYVTAVGNKPMVWTSTNTIYFIGRNNGLTTGVDVSAGIHCKGYY